MSASDRRIAAGAALALASCLALAGIGKTGEAPGSTTDPGVAAGAAEDGVQLRCWQHGRLIFDARGLEAPPKVTAAALALAGKTAAGTLQVLNLESALCLVQPGAGAAATRYGEPGDGR